ncbi:MAG: ABC transporter ATP-binding protein [Chloroflexota bacterium]
MSKISLEGVSKRFVLHHQRARSFQDALVNALTRRNESKEEFWALRDVTFEALAGENLGIVGRNGSGKSTALKLITRILEPTSGRVTVRGRVSALIELGAGFHPDLTGRENVFLNGSILGMSRKQMRARLDEIVGFAQMERFIDTPVKHYSSGMYARLGFAVAISVEPEILIIDEVLSVGDEAFQRRCLEKIREFRSNGVSIVFVSHSLEAVRNLCDRAVWLEQGTVKMLGSAHEVVDAYLVDANVSADAANGAGAASRGSSERRRWGSGEVQVTRVDLLGADGKARRWFATGESFTVRLHYHADGCVLGPVFGIGLHSSNGVHLSGPNTSKSGYVIDSVSGDGSVDFCVADLPLVTGAYELSAAIYDYTCTHAYDHHHRMYPFEVRSGGGDLGLVRLASVWEHRPARKLESASSTTGHQGAAD